MLFALRLCLDSPCALQGVQHREIMKDAAAEYEEVPDGVVVGQPVPDIENDADGV